MSDNYQASLRDKLTQLPLVDPPLPWRRVGEHGIGGLAHIGYAEETDLLLVVSGQGRGLFDCTTGTRVARDRDEDWSGLDPIKLTSPGIGPVSDQVIRLAGLLGGGLKKTSGIWGLEFIPLPWPRHFVFLFPLSKSNLFDQWTKIATDGACEFRACGFSQTGRTFVVATSCELVIFARSD